MDAVVDRAASDHVWVVTCWKWDFRFITTGGPASAFVTCLAVDTSPPPMYNTVRFCLSSKNRWGSLMYPQLPRSQATSA